MKKLSEHLEFKFVHIYQIFFQIDHFLTHISLHFDSGSPASNIIIDGQFSRMAATCFVQPLDLVKNRMQVMKITSGPRPSSFSVLMGVVRNEGFTTLYNGLSAGLLRQATYTTTRFVSLPRKTSSASFPPSPVCNPKDLSFWAPLELEVMIFTEEGIKLLLAWHSADRIVSVPKPQIKVLWQQIKLIY